MSMELEADVEKRGINTSYVGGGGGGGGRHGNRGTPTSCLTLPQLSACVVYRCYSVHQSGVLELPAEGGGGGGGGACHHLHSTATELWVGLMTSDPDDVDTRGRETPVLNTREVERH